MVKRTSTSRMTEKQDMAADKRAGIKEGSKRDQAVDKKRGLPADTKVTRVTRRKK